MKKFVRFGNKLATRSIANNTLIALTSTWAAYALAANVLILTSIEDEKYINVKAFQKLWLDEKQDDQITELCKSLGVWDYITGEQYCLMGFSWKTHKNISKKSHAIHSSRNKVL